MKKAFITGINGQDGSYLAEYLLSKNYEVHGIVRRNSTPESQSSRIDFLEKKITTYYGDILDMPSIVELLSAIQPDEIYNLAAQSHVRVSFDIPYFTVLNNSIGILNVLEAYRKVCPNAKMYQASSSEMFGLSVDKDGFQRESTPMNPVSPYGCSKVFGYNITRNYRRAYNLQISNGILFNHESPRRGSNFVTTKVVKGAVECLIKKRTYLELGNMDSYRDWGHSKDYVRAMHLILQNPPDDWVVSTGETHSVREMCEIVFNYLGLDYKKYIVQNPKLLRPEELPYLKGDPSRIKSLGWTPEYDFKSLMIEMTSYWLDHYNVKL